MAAKKPGAPATVTLKHLAANLSESHEMSKKQTEAVLGDLVNLVTKHLKKGDRIRIGGLGILVVRKRAARMGRNPATGARRCGHFFRIPPAASAQAADGFVSRFANAPGALRAQLGLACRPKRRGRKGRVGGDGLEPPTSCV